MPLVSISDAQRAPMPNANFVATVLPRPCRTTCYAPILTRRAAAISPSSAASRRRSGPTAPSRIAQSARRAAQDRRQGRPRRRAYFREQIEPLLRQPGVEFIGEIDERAKAEFLGEARALLFPIDWPEPFGLVMIEAMACGTPVLAFRRGSVPEVIDDGVTGYIVDTEDEAIRQLPQVLALDRRACAGASRSVSPPRAWRRITFRSIVRSCEGLCQSAMPIRASEWCACPRKGG